MVVVEDEDWKSEAPTRRGTTDRVPMIRIPEPEDANRQVCHGLPTILEQRTRAVNSGTLLSIRMFTWLGMCKLQQYPVVS